MFDLPLLFKLLPSSDPGHKEFWKRETDSMFSLRKTLERCVIAHVRILTEEYLGFPAAVATIFELSSNYCIIPVLIFTVV